MATTKRKTKKDIKDTQRIKVQINSPRKKALRVAKKATQKVKTVPRKEVLPILKRDALGHLLVENLLREAGFRGDISTDKDKLDEYSYDESIFAVRPQIVIAPKDGMDVQSAVKVIAKETTRFPALSLTPRAAGTGLSGGSLTDSVVIDISRYMHKMDLAEEMRGQVTITVEPGVMWRDMETELKKHRVYVPSYTASKDICSVGGSVANNAAGPDSLRYGHCADWVESLEVVLYDGEKYTIRPIDYKNFKVLSKKKNAYGRILSEIFALIEANEPAILKAKPKTKKNTSGYALWDAIDGSVAEFKAGKAKLDLTRLISGSQGTIGIVTSLTLKTAPIPTHNRLVVIPIFDLATASAAVLEALNHNPVNIEVFDALSFNLALKNPQFFKSRLSGIGYYRTMLAMYSLYHVRWLGKTPEFTLLMTFEDKSDTVLSDILRLLRKVGASGAREVTNEDEKEMLWQVRRASYTLSKLQDPNKRPAAFLEDMTVPPEHLSGFLAEIKRLLRKYNLTAAIHGHGGNGHFHFYPLLDFEKSGTAELIEKMSTEFFHTAVKYKGNICGEHNDGITRTPYLNLMFTKKMLDIFKQVEHSFDPDDIFNPGKKVNPRFDIKSNLRKKN
ncbi:hypothetical protein CL653_00615 [bacterium]|nr:hypothetical protein [bacterium]